MAQTTEAACLLQSGTMYPRRLGLRTVAGVDLFAGVKPGGVSLYFGDDPIYHFDLDGRWQRAFLEGTHYLKGLDATVRSIDRVRTESGLVLRREALPYARAVDLDASIRSVALGLIDDLDAGRLEILATPPTARAFEPEEFREFLERVVGWDSAAWFAHRERYLSTYGPIPFLPPDCPNALILQATLGHFDGLAFGRGRPAEHYVRSPEEFRDHVQAVKRLVGRRVAQHRGVFLGGADVLRSPLDEVLRALEAIGQAFPPGKGADGWDGVDAHLGNVHAFLDSFAPPLPDLEGWRLLRDAGLAQVTLGIESGDREVRSEYGKGWNDSELRSTVGALKAASLGVGLVVLAGAGGAERSSRHVDATCTLIESLPLEATDLITMVDARSLDDSPIEGSRPLSDEETTGQITAIKARLAAGRTSKGPKVVAYNPDKRWT